MKTDYKTELGKSYLVLDCEEREDIFAMQMLEENHICSLLPFERRCFNGELQFFYDVTEMCTMAERVEKKPLGAKDVRRLLQGLYCVFEEIHSFFLEADGLLLQAEYIYETQDKMLFCYFPSKEVDGLDFGIEVFAEKLLDQLDNDDEEALQMAYQFYALVKDAKKGILYILEEVLTKEEPVYEPPRMPEEIPAADLTVSAEEKKVAEKTPDVCMVGCFGLSFLSCFCCLFLLPASFGIVTGVRVAAGILIVLSIAGIWMGWTDIDIKRKK